LDVFSWRFFYKLAGIAILSVCCIGYGFVDFELAEDAERAVAALQSRGIQAQMAKVSYCIVLSCLCDLLMLNKQASTPPPPLKGIFVFRTLEYCTQHIVGFCVFLTYLLTYLLIE